MCSQDFADRVNFRRRVSRRHLYRIGAVSPWSGRDRYTINCDCVSYTVLLDRYYVFYDAYYFVRTNVL